MKNTHKREKKAQLPTPFHECQRCIFAWCHQVKSWCHSKQTNQCAVEPTLYLAQEETSTYWISPNIRGNQEDDD